MKKEITFQKLNRRTLSNYLLVVNFGMKEWKLKKKNPKSLSPANAKIWYLLSLHKSISTTGRNYVFEIGRRDVTVGKFLVQPLRHGTESPHPPVEIGLRYLKIAVTSPG